MNETFSTQLRTPSELKAIADDLYSRGESLAYDIFMQGLEFYNESSSLGVGDITELANKCDQLREDSENLEMRLQECDSQAFEILDAVDHLEDLIIDNPEVNNKIAEHFRTIRTGIDNIFSKCSID